MVFFKKQGKGGKEDAPAEKPVIPGAAGTRDWIAEQDAKNKLLFAASPKNLSIKMKQPVKDGEPKVVEVPLALKKAKDDMGTKTLDYESADGAIKIGFVYHGYSHNYVSFEKLVGGKKAFSFFWSAGHDFEEPILFLQSFGVGNLGFITSFGGMSGSRVALVIPPGVDEMKKTFQNAADNAAEIIRVHDEENSAVHNALAEAGTKGGESIVTQVFSALKKFSENQERKKDEAEG